MAYIRYKVTDELHKIIKDVCKRMGLKESELSRTAIIEYLKSLKAFDKK
jgi:antitoxin component of RelBE/YafQ-DinJ toxin-antitoxin module